MYEERGNELTARTQNPTVVDPLSKTRMCRELATRKPDAAPQSRVSLLSHKKINDFAFKGN